MREKDLNIGKLQRVMRKAKKPDCAPYTISIKKMCEKADMTAFFNVIRNRIYNEMEQDEKMGDYIRLDADNMEDLYLDDKGVFMFSEILMGYFGEQQIIDLWKYLDAINKPIYTEMSIQQAIESYDTKKLKEMLQQYKEASDKAPQSDYKEAAETLKEMIAKELKKRRSLWLHVLRA